MKCSQGSFGYASAYFIEEAFLHWPRELVVIAKSQSGAGESFKKAENFPKFDLMLEVYTIFLAQSKGLFSFSFSIYKPHIQKKSMMGKCKVGLI